MTGIDFATKNEYDRCRKVYFERCGDPKFLEAMKHCSERWEAKWPTKMDNDGMQDLYMIFFDQKAKDLWEDVVRKTIKCVQDAERMTKD